MWAVCSLQLSMLSYCSWSMYCKALLRLDHLSRPRHASPHIPASRHLILILPTASGYTILNSTWCLLAWVWSHLWGAGRLDGAGTGLEVKIGAIILPFFLPHLLFLSSSLSSSISSSLLVFLLFSFLPSSFSFFLLPFFLLPPSPLLFIHFFLLLLLFFFSVAILCL